MEIRFVVVRNRDLYPYRNKRNIIGDDYHVFYMEKSDEWFTSENVPDNVKEFLENHVDNHSGYCDDFYLYDEYYYKKF